MDRTGGAKPGNDDDRQPTPEEAREDAVAAMRADLAAPPAFPGGVVFDLLDDR